MSFAVQVQSHWQAKLSAQWVPSNAQRRASVGQSKRLAWLNFDLLEIIRHRADGRAMRELSDRQLCDAGIDLSQAGRGRAAACRIATIANLQGLR
jgi:hypothetical protein